MLNESNVTADVLDRALAAGVWQESPLVGLDALLGADQARDKSVFRLRERPFLELVNIRGDARDPVFVEASESILGCRPPTQPNTVARGTHHDVLWLGPDEWLVRSTLPHDAASAAPLEQALRTRFGTTFASATDVGSGYTVLEISGSQVRDVLSRGCPLDLHPRVFTIGQCAQSLYFKASLTLMQTAEDTFELIIRRSFADYFVRIMLDAAAPLRT